MECKACGCPLQSPMIAHLEGRDYLVCQHCHQDQRYPVEDRPDFPDDRDVYGYDDQTWDDYVNELEEERRKRYGKFGPRD